MFVDDESDSGACTTSSTECFVQSFVIDSMPSATHSQVLIYFSNNTAIGADIFGGLLNKCS